MGEHTVDEKSLWFLEREGGAGRGSMRKGDQTKLGIM